MAEFKYKAKDLRGQIKSGVVKASSKSQAKSVLVRMRLKPITITAHKLDGAPGTEKPGIIGRDAKGNITINIGSDPKPTEKDLIIFTKQFATMINSGVPMIQSLGILASQQRVKSFGRILEKIRHAVENGATLSDSLQAFPKLFDSLYISMVRAGEISGGLDTILLKLVSYIEKAAKIKGQVKAASFYPGIIVVVAASVISGLLIFVVPTFARQFTDSGKELPALTALVMAASDALVNYWYIIVGGIIAAFLLFRAYVATPAGRERFDYIVLKLPGFGLLFRKIAVGRFCSTMSTMLSSGVNLLEALSICAASAGNKTIEKFILKVRASVEQGSKISDPLGSGDIFPSMVVSMVAVGESTGALDEMLHKVSEFYEEEVDLAVKTILSMIEPIMIVGIGSIVGFIVVAMYLPIFQMGSTM